MKTGIASINNAKLYYEIEGNGPPLLLIHAGIADHRMFNAQVAGLKDQFQIVRLDLRGFGKSDMPAGQFANHEDIKSFLNYLGIKHVIVLGISFGGLIAIDFTLEYPEYVLALILGTPSVSGAKPSERIKNHWKKEEVFLDKNMFQEAAMINIDFWVVMPGRKTSDLNPVLIDNVFTMQMETLTKDVPDDIESIAPAIPAIERLHDIQCPTLILVGENDLEEKIELCHQLAQKISDGATVMIKNAGHMLNMEQPHEFNDLVSLFLNATRVMKQNP